MKIKKEHYDHIEKAIIDKTPVNLIKEWSVKYANQGYSDMRFRWDLFWACGVSDWVRENVYPYANDDCIDTVLRKVVKKALKD